MLPSPKREGAILDQPNSVTSSEEKNGVIYKTKKTLQIDINRILMGVNDRMTVKRIYLQVESYLKAQLRTRPRVIVEE